MKLIIVLFMLISASVHVSANTKLTDFQVDYQEKPTTLETERPLFSWRMESDNGLGQQEAYAIEVVSEAGEVVWDSGKTVGTASVGIEYDGQKLEPASRYQWKVKVWRENGEKASGSSWFETGFMVDGDSSWPGADWIGGGDRDLVFYSDYFTVFRAKFDIRLESSSNSDKAAFLLGGNDFRLMDKNLNLQGMENDQDESYVALELDISGIEGEEGNAKLNIYRVGYASSDRKDKPLTVLQIPRTLLNRNNQYDSHSIDARFLFGLLTVYVNGTDDENRITPYDPDLPPSDPQGVNINPVAFNGSLEPTGNPGDYISFPAVSDIGFWLRPGQEAEFSRVEIRNYREPSNILFAAGSGVADQYDEIFDTKESSPAIEKQAEGSYKIEAKNNDFLTLKDPSRLSAPMLRTEFELQDKDIEKARIYATARGIYELYLNGDRVGDNYFSPGLTQYNKHHAYQAYDVTQELRKGGANALGAWISEGWWSGNITYNGVHWNFFGDRQSLLAKLVVTYEDGSTQEVSTNPENWRVFHGGPIRYGSFFQGEVYDARLSDRIEDWATHDYDDSHWESASLVPLEGSAFMAEPGSAPESNEIITGYDDMDLIGQTGRNPEVVRVLQAQSVEEVRPGVFVYDMGQNMVGVPEIELDSAEPGDRIVMRYAEMRYPDLPEHENNVGMVMMENIRGALTHDTYYAKGGGETIKPKFTFHGYRYLEITGIDEALPLDAVKGKVISSVSELTADYETSNERVNKLWENITWSMRSNFLSIPTDTPARNERMGWSGDINVFARTATYMADVDAFLRRHLMAMRDIQADNGRFPDVAPVGTGFGGILWGSAGVTLPWELYQQYGDIKTLSAHYPAMERYLDFLWTKRDKDTGILLEGPLGDWLSPEGRQNDNTLLWEAYHVHLLDIMAQMAQLLDKLDDAALYQQRYRERKEFFNQLYVDKETGKTVHSGMVSGFFADPEEVGQIDSSLRGDLVDTQASYAIPLALGVFQPENLELAEEHLAQTIKRENVDDQGKTRPSCSLMTGFIGTASLMEALSNANQYNPAYCLLQQESYPSWLYSVINGATTIWERLNSYTKEDGFGGNNSMNSFNHYSFGSVGAWMMGHSVGIQRDPKVPAFKEFVLEPTPDPEGRMTWAKGHYDSLYGRIESEWRIGSDGNVRYEFVVPENTHATLRLKADSREQLKSYESSVNENRAKPITIDQGRLVFKVSPGRHVFTITQ